jgi:hypothetical protein
MSLASSLYDDNPWWADPNKIADDPKIKEWSASSIKWDPRIRQTFDFGNDVLYSLRGPRQVGKTTLLKLQIRDFLAKGVSPWNLMYYAFDVDNSSKNIVEIIENYLTNTARRRGKNRTFLFLDEVSKVKNWQDGIKRLKDAGKLDNCTVIVTGSHMIDLKKSLENLTGRRGKTDDAYDKIILPMKFSEYVPLVNPRFKRILDENNLTKREDRIRTINKLLDAEIEGSLDNLQPYIAELNSMLADYMLTGGIPQVVNRYYETGFLDDYLYSTYLDYILGDLKSLKKNQTLFRQLIANIIGNISWPQSWLSLQKDTDIKNPHTVLTYVDDLTHMFVLTRFYSYDPVKKRMLLRKNKKIHFHDPFFLHAINSWLSDKKPFKASQLFIENETNQGTLVEGIVGDHLIRLAFSLAENKQNFDYSNNVFFWNLKKEKEVDYVLHLGNKPDFPIEVKYRTEIESKHHRGISYFNSLAKTKNALILSKITLNKSENTVILPTSIFLLLI